MTAAFKSCELNGSHGIEPNQRVIFSASIIHEAQWRNRGDEHAANRSIRGALYGTSRAANTEDDLKDGHICDRSNSLANNAGDLKVQ